MSFWQITTTPVHEASIDGPRAWNAASFADPDTWTYRFSPETLKEMAAAVEQRTFLLPSLAGDVSRIRTELTAGRGFVLLRGLPAHQFGEEDLKRLYWTIGEMLGAPLPQNVKGDMLYSVRDEGQRIERDYGRVGVRFSKTSEGLQFHTDSAPALMGNTPCLIGLLVLRIAQAGGASALVSAASLHNALLKERPDYLRRLYQPYHFDRSAEWRPGEPRTLLAPVFTFHQSLAVRYFRYYIPKGHELAGALLEPDEVASFDYMDGVLNRPELQVRFEMQPGDIQLLDNRAVLHSRTSFTDWEDIAQKRHLLRLWLGLRD